MKGPRHASELPDLHNLNECPVEPKRDLPIPAVNWHLPEDVVPSPNPDTDDLVVSYDDPRGFAKFDAIYAPAVFCLARDQKCALCKGDLKVACFIGGESTFVNGRYSDGPMHAECAVASMTLCPHLRLHRHRRTSETRQQHAEGLIHIENDNVRGERQYIVLSRGYHIEMSPMHMEIVVPPEARLGFQAYRYVNGEIEADYSQGLRLDQLPEGY